MSSTNLSKFNAHRLNYRSIIVSFVPWYLLIPCLVNPMTTKLQVNFMSVTSTNLTHKFYDELQLKKKLETTIFTTLPCQPTHMEIIWIIHLFY